jgi:hypothetical protein
MVEAEGKIINKAIYYLRDTLIGYSKNTYTGNNLTEVKFFDSKNDTLFMSVVYNYDQDGNRIKFQTFNYKNEPGGYREFSYTAEGFLEHVRAYSETGEMTQLYDYTYNDQGDRIAELNNENIAKEVTIDYTYKYEYDKKGNWVKCVFYIDNQPYMLREREIKYYN